MTTDTTMPEPNPTEIFNPIAAKWGLLTERARRIALRNFLDWIATVSDWQAMSSEAVQALYEREINKRVSEEIHDRIWKKDRDEQDQIILDGRTKEFLGPRVLDSAADSLDERMDLMLSQVMNGNDEAVVYFAVAGVPVQRLYEWHTDPKRGAYRIHGEDATLRHALADAAFARLRNPRLADLKYEAIRRMQTKIGDDLDAKLIDFADRPN